MNCDSCDDPKNSRTAAMTGFALIRSCGIAVDHFLVHRHLFLDRAFHADQTDAELILEQFTDRANAAISKVIDVIDLSDVLAQLQQVADDGVEIFLLENPRVRAASRDPA